MARAARIGQGKSRLAAEIGRVEAWRAQRWLQARTFRAAFDPRWSTLVCVTPDGAVGLRTWPRGAGRLAQGRGDLGARLARALGGRRNVAVVGADCPGLTRAHIWAGFRALRRKRFALGPAEDGGFWLLAAREGARAGRAMAGVRWSSADASGDVLAHLGAENVALLARLRDVDVAADLPRRR